MDVGGALDKKNQILNSPTVKLEFFFFVLLEVKLVNMYITGCTIVEMP